MRMRGWFSSAVVVMSAWAPGCAAQHGDGAVTSKKSPESVTTSADQAAAPEQAATYSVPRHPLLTTRGPAPRTSLAVNAETGFDVARDARGEASATYKRYSERGVATSQRGRLVEALEFAPPRTAEVAELRGGATLHRVDAVVTVGDRLAIRSLMSYLRRIERHAFLTVSAISFSTNKRWWGVCRREAAFTISGWFARGTPSLPETQVHLPKVSATRIAHALVNYMREGQLNQVTVGTRGFKAKGVVTSAQALESYVERVTAAHRCVKSVDATRGPVEEGSAGVPFELVGALKCRTR